MNAHLARRDRFDIDGCGVSTIVAGDRRNPAVLLLHGFPNSARTFERLATHLSDTCFVIAPDMPGSGATDLIAEPSFTRFADLVEGLLEKLGVASVFLYVHDYGAPVALDLAMRDPRRVRGLIVQNANAHATGWGPAWKDTIDYWHAPSKENEKAATAHLTFEGVCYQYIGDIPEDIAARISPDDWDEDWRMLSRPGHLDVQRALVKDYGNYAARFDDISRYLREHQPPALMLWGRHDSFFDCAEIVSWLQDLPRMEAHVLDGPHLLLETHGERCAALIADFVTRT
ncbi:alpha/beta fold hydrolase [Variovorax sp. 770b2]|uniref:alpha/beta fold hydrolase n=1 Tax=Variovorax sp. 770b2 TaxID=1566271 RepID=UPI0008F2808D|nr:alpha/beta hydrolase [Variovorax sp. 770b2]SFP51760.1 Pimeloyl-ACP methyl ester carboxylesterase [Variovorax sp. 770b2]